MSLSRESESGDWNQSEMLREYVVRGWSLPLLMVVALWNFNLTIARSQDAELERSVIGKEQVTSAQQILLARCLDCHHAQDAAGGLDLSTLKTALAGGESGSSLDLDQPLESLLWARVEADEMPPESPLDLAERNVLRKWLLQGAAWPAQPLDRFAISTSHRAGRDWWSWQPLSNTLPPIDGTDTWGSNELDRFVLQKLKQTGLVPSKRADPRTLARRLNHDLLGLPPSTEAIDTFASDPTESAWMELVDEALASPRYGEHWASHWLDIARFGESHGFEYNQPRPNAWHYRDWVIETFPSMSSRAGKLQAMVDSANTVKAWRR
jgi:hypothetical protein